MSKLHIMLVSTVSVAGTVALLSTSRTGMVLTNVAKPVTEGNFRLQGDNPPRFTMHESRGTARNCELGRFTSKPLPLPAEGTTPAKFEAWDERYRGRDLDLAGSSLVYCEDFNHQISLNGPNLWAKQHADVGLAKFDGPNGEAYKFANDTLTLQVYDAANAYRGANVQSINANQAYQGEPIAPGKKGYTCTGCYWEARVQFPQARGGWGAFWLLTPDNPRNRGHFEVDVIEYYGLTDRRGHHHSVHNWKNGASHTVTDYTGMDAIADFKWHTYGVDLRGISKLGGQPAIVIYMDNKEVGRIVRKGDLLSKPFYYLFSMTLNPREMHHDVPQFMQVDYVRAYRRTLPSQ